MSNSSSSSVGMINSQSFTSYDCITQEDLLCAMNCMSLQECSTCNCTLASGAGGASGIGDDNITSSIFNDNNTTNNIDDLISSSIDTGVDATAAGGGGPWGEVMDVIFCLLPILFLLIATIKPKPLPTTLSLPISAALLYIIRLAYLGDEPTLVTAAVIQGLHEAFTPLSIIGGAMFLFETMEATLCLPYIMREMKILTAGHPIAELMLIYAFAYMVEGASGFGTPVALAAPMLVSNGHPALESVVVLLVMNTFATVWGAVGTPIWFGFGNLNLEESEFLNISSKSSIALSISGFILMPFVLTILTPFPIVKQNIVFVLLSLCVTVGPNLILSFFSYEFPSLVGGMVGCLSIAMLIQYKIGLHPISDEHKESHLDGRNLDEIGSVSEHSIVRRNKAKIDFKKSTSNISDVTDTDNMDSGRGGTGTGSLSAQRPKPIAECGEEEHQESESGVDLDAYADAVSHLEEGGCTDSTTGDAPESSPTPEAIVTAAAADKKNTTIDPTIEVGDVLSNVNNNNGNATGSVIMDLVETHLGPRKSMSERYIQEMLLRTFPIWGVIVVLILTRIEDFQIKPLLTSRDQSIFTIYFGTYGDFKLSTSLVLQLVNILGVDGISWKYELLYIPFLIPFVFVSVITMIIHRADMARNNGINAQTIVKTVCERLQKPAIALLGALVLVQLLIRSGESAPAFILGSILAKWFQQGFIVICPLLGALGSFFSGSTTVSNLTFGGIQKIAAESIGTSTSAMLALQAVGASAGNGICLNNIIAACAVVGLNIGEGQILLKTYKYVFANTTLATIIMLTFFFRF